MGGIELMEQCDVSYKLFTNTGLSRSVVGCKMCRTPVERLVYFLEAEGKPPHTVTISLARSLARPPTMPCSLVLSTLAALSLAPNGVDRRTAVATAAASAAAILPVATATAASLDSVYDSRVWIWRLC